MRTLLSRSILLFLCLVANAFCDEANLLILNMENISVLPRNFRTSSGHIAQTWDTAPNLKGLNSLHISGSGQFSQKSLDSVIQYLHKPQNLIVVDLRQETHGFVNGFAISWYSNRNWGNKGKSLEAIVANENRLLADLSKQKKIELYRVIEKNPQGVPRGVEPFFLTVETVANEEEVAKAAQAGYIRIPVSDHSAPTDDEVERFIAFYKGLPQNRWLHFHCAAGEGRTTTFMAMVDMLQNAKEVSFDDIIHRQWLLGGARLSKMPDPDSWQFPYSQARYEFLKKFYDYIRSGANENWTEFSQHAMAEKGMN